MAVHERIGPIPVAPAWNAQFNLAHWLPRDVNVGKVSGTTSLEEHSAGYTVADLAVPAGDTGRPVRFIARQAGSGTRLLMDHLLLQHGIAPEAITGYASPPEDSHMAVAAAIASGVGDVGMGLAAAAQAFGLDFVPVMDEDYFLVCLKDALEHPAVLKLREVLAGAAWHQAVATLPGYSGARSGEVLSLTGALPWWNFRHPKHLPADAAEDLPVG